MADKLVEYARMDLPRQNAHAEGSVSSPPVNQPSHRYLWAIGLVIAAAIIAIAFGAYRQPELLMNLIGLRYCGTAIAYADVVDP